MTQPADRVLGRGASLVRIGAVYLVATVVAAVWLLFGPDTRWLWLDSLVADVLATLVVFAASRIYRNSSCYDAFWSVAPPLLATFWWLSSPDGVDGVRTALVLVVVWVWAVRLTRNWAIGFPGLHHEDWRYPLLRDRAGRAELAVDLVAIHLVPTLQVFLGLVPVYVALTRPGRGVAWLDVVAVLVGLGAVVLETAADAQMRAFVRTRAPGEVMDRGLWGWSRHPNYVGELAFWLALALFGLAAWPAAWWQLAGAAAMLAMFLGASIPMMEQRSLERRPGYRDVVERVPMFLPRPPRRGPTTGPPA